MDVTRVHLRVPVAGAGDIMDWEQSQVTRLGDAAIQVLERVGMRVEGDAYLPALEAAGAQVERGAGVVRFSADQVHETARRMASPMPASERPPLTRLERQAPPYFMGGGGNTYFDWDRREVVAATREHLVAACRLASGLTGVIGMNPPVQVKDVDPRLEPIASFATLIQNTPRDLPVSPYIPSHPAHVKWLKRMGEAVAARRGGAYHMHDQEYVNAPLGLGGRALDTHAARIEHGCATIGCGSMAVSGLTAPVTVAGTAAVTIAEILGAATVVRLLWPQVKLYGIAASGRLDMATTNVSFCSPRAQLQNLACVEVCRRAFGIAIARLTGYRDANEPGLQACYEYAYLSMLHQCLSPGPLEMGMLANSNLFSPEQFVLDMHMECDLREVLAGFAADDDAIGLAMIAETGLDHRAVLEHPHTLAHFRDALPLTAFWPRGQTAAAGHDEARNAPLARAHEVVVSAMANARPPDRDPAFDREISGMVTAAAAELGVG